MIESSNGRKPTGAVALIHKLRETLEVTDTVWSVKQIYAVALLLCLEVSCFTVSSTKQEQQWDAHLHL